MQHGSLAAKRKSKKKWNKIKTKTNPRDEQIAKTPFSPRRCVSIQPGATYRPVPAAVNPLYCNLSSTKRKKKKGKKCHSNIFLEDYPMSPDHHENGFFPFSSFFFFFLISFSPRIDSFYSVFSRIIYYILIYISYFR